MVNQLKKLLLPILLFALFLLYFGRVLFEGEQFFFRDSGFFYYPLWKQIQEQWSSGMLPLWDPFENLGQPLLANPTSAVFYPLKMVFLLDSWGLASYDNCFKWFILVHYPLAFFGFYRFGRRVSLSTYGATLGAFAYTAGGVVLFLACNPVFLIGAAWLPWALYFGERVLSQPTRGAITALALVGTMMVFGGDPEIAYLTGLLLLGWAFVRSLNAQNSFKDTFRISVWRLLGSAVLTAFLSAAILLPSMEMERYSDRSLSDVPVSIWDIPSAIYQRNTPQSDSDSFFPRLDHENQKQCLTDGFLCRAINERGHRQSIYHFSLGPWRLLELGFPNIGGNWQIGNCRWMMFFPHEDQVWVPSLYMGVITFLLAISVLFCPGTNRTKLVLSETDTEKKQLATTERWLRWMLVLAILGSLGGFGLIWFFRTIGVLLGSGQNLTLSDGDPIGGVYWFMNVLLPKFSTFRYPAKLMTVAAFALAMLAGISWDRLLACPDHRSRVWRIGWAFELVTLFALFIVGLFGLPWLEPLKTKMVPGNVPLDVIRCWEQICQSLFQTAVVLGAFLFLLHLVGKRLSLIRFFPVTVLLLVMADLYFAHRDLIPTVPQEYYKSPLLADEIHRKQQTGRFSKLIFQRLSILQVPYFMEDAGETPAFPGGFENCPTDFNMNIPPVRAYRSIPMNPFVFIPDPARYAHSFVWDQKTLAPKYPWSQQIAIANVYGTVMSADYALFLQGVEKRLTDQQGGKELATAFAQTGIDYFVFPLEDLAGQSVTFDGLERLDENMPSQFSLRTDFANAWNQFGLDWPVNTLLWKLASPSQRVRIERKEESPSINNELDLNKPLLFNESAAIICYQPNQMMLQVDLIQPGSVVIAEQYWPGWTAQATSKEGTVFNPSIQKERGILRKIDLPAGSWKVELRYRPLSVIIGIVLSLATWLGVGFYYVIRIFFHFQSCKEIIK